MTIIQLPDLLEKFGNIRQALLEDTPGILRSHLNQILRAILQHPEGYKLDPQRIMQMRQEIQSIKKSPKI